MPSVSYRSKSNALVLIFLHLSTLTIRLGIEWNFAVSVQFELCNVQQIVRTPCIGDFFIIQQTFFFFFLQSMPNCLNPSVWQYMNTIILCKLSVLDRFGYFVGRLIRKACWTKVTHWAFGLVRGGYQLCLASIKINSHSFHHKLPSLMSKYSLWVTKIRVAPILSCPFSQPEVPKDPEEAARLQQLQAAAAQWQQVQQQRASLQYQALMQQHEKLQKILEKYQELIQQPANLQVGERLKESLLS